MEFHTLAKDLTNEKKVEEIGKSIYSRLDKDRIKTANSIKKISNYNDFNLYQMDVYYDYQLDKAIKVWDKYPSSDEIMEFYIGHAIPGCNMHFDTPNYGCAAFKLKEFPLLKNDTCRNKKNDINVFTGRSYDFLYDTSAMLVRCNPSNGYKSVSFVGLDHIKILNPTLNEFCRLACLSAPFVPLDGMNEKGVSVAVLSLDSPSTRQNNKKPLLTPGTFDRLILDKASSTEDAINILQNYDMFSVCNSDYHYFINDKNGNSVVVEYDCNDKERTLKATPTQSITNFYKIYEDKVLPNQNNGIYGHGKERRDIIDKVIKDNGGYGGIDVCWKALQSCAQHPKSNCMTSNTQWSSVYNNTTLEFEICLRQKWSDIFKFHI